MAQRWTEGPWKIDGLTVLGADNRIVCMLGDPAQYPGDLSSDFPNKEANGRLIAHAPKLFEILDELVSEIEGPDADIVGSSNDVKRASQLLSKIRGAS